MVPVWVIGFVIDALDSLVHNLSAVATLLYDQPRALTTSHVLSKHAFRPSAIQESVFTIFTSQIGRSSRCLTPDW